MQSIAPDELDSVSHWHFAVGGLQTQQDVLELARAIRLERLKTFPSHTELAFSLNNLAVAGVMAHYGETLIQHELIIDAEHVEDAQLIPATAGAILAGLRIRTGAEVLCPAVCEKSWTALRGITGNSCRAYRVEQALFTHAFGVATLVLLDDLLWVRDNLAKLMELTEEERFSTALEALCSYLHAANYRMMAAQLWAGVEALFEVQYEISFRLPLLVALLLEERGPSCRDLWKRVRKLYNERSRAIHGGKVTDDKLRQHVADVRALLARLLARIIQRGQLPTASDFEDLPLMP